MNEDSGLVLSNKAYDRTKWFTTIFLPAFGALYFGVAQIWGLPKAEEVVGTITVVATFLGVLLGISSRAYNSEAALDGQLVPAGSDPDTGMTNLKMILNKTPEDVLQKKTVRLKVPDDV